jgi:phenylacetate-CoA ligase
MIAVEDAETALRFVASLKRTERLSPADLARYQRPQIERLCRHAALETAFNSERLRVLFEGGDAREGRFLFENWRRVTPFNRADAQPINNLLHARSVPPVAGPTRMLHTSGSSGRPLEFGRSALAETASLARGELMYEAHGFDPNERMGWILFVNEKEGWTERQISGWNLRNPKAELFLLSKAATMDQCVDWLRRVQPRYLMAPPSVVGGIVDALAGSSGEPVRLDRVFVTSETPREGLAEDVSAAFGARLVDQYGAREVGEIACTCPENGPAKHVAADTMLVEIIRPDGQPAAPGEMGAVIVTPFYNYATPFIRYDIGDFAIQGASMCACGRTLPLIERVLGRQHALFQFKDGAARFPVGLNGMRQHVPWLQMQVAQIALDRFEVRYVPDPAGAAPDFEAALRIARGALHSDAVVEFVAMNQIEPGSGGKFEDLVSLIARDASPAGRRE